MSCVQCNAGQCNQVVSTRQHDDESAVVTDQEGGQDAEMLLHVRAQHFVGQDTQFVSYVVI